MASLIAAFTRCCLHTLLFQAPQATPSHTNYVSDPPQAVYQQHVVYFKLYLYFPEWGGWAMNKFRAKSVQRDWTSQLELNWVWEYSGSRKKSEYAWPIVLHPLLKALWVKHMNQILDLWYLYFWNIFVD